MISSALDEKLAEAQRKTREWARRPALEDTTYRVSCVVCDRAMIALDRCPMGRWLVYYCQLCRYTVRVSGLFHKLNLRHTISTTYKENSQ